MRQPIAIIGVGEVGEVFACGFLKLGHPVYPILRGASLSEASRSVQDPVLVIAAVGEDDLAPVLQAMPQGWRSRLAVLQNEVLPRDWQRHGIVDPTVIVVWFDKKKGRPFVPVLPTAVGGPEAHRVVAALEQLEIPCYPVPDKELLYEMVRKNLYILTINIAGLRLQPGSTVGQLWTHHRPLAEAVAKDVLDIQERCAGTALQRERLLAGMLDGFDGDPGHICTGRTAPARLRRALSAARAAGIAAPALSAIAREVGFPVPSHGTAGS